MKIFRLANKNMRHLFHPHKPHHKETNGFIFTTSAIDTGGFKNIPQCTKNYNTLNYHSNMSKLWEQNHPRPKKSLQECLKTFAPSSNKNNQNIYLTKISNSKNISR